LNSHGIGDFAHDATEGVDLAHQMTLGHAADCRITAHLRNQVQIHGDQGCLQPHARGRHRGFASGVTGADYDDIVLFCECHLVGEKPYTSILRIPGIARRLKLRGPNSVCRLPPQSADLESLRRRSYPQQMYVELRDETHSRPCASLL